MLNYSKDNLDAQLGVSVVVPVYRTNPVLLKSCLESVARQVNGTFPIEAVVVFDGTPSRELHEIVDSYAEVCSVRIVEIENQGVSAARNVGIRYACQPWVFFLDSDDELPEASLSLLLEFALKTSSDVVMGNHEALLSNGLVERHCYFDAAIKPSPKFAEQLRHDVLKPRKAAGLACGKLYRKELLQEDALGFNEHLAQGEDTEFVFRVLQATDAIGYINATVYRYRRNSTSAVRAFRGDYVDRIMLSMGAMRNQIELLPSAFAYQKDYSGYVLFHLLLIMVHYLFNPSAPWSEARRRVEFASVLSEPLFVEALGQYEPKDFSLTRRVSLFALKHQIYPLCSLIANVRQRQLG